MTAKFSELTIQQILEFCNARDDCIGCPMRCSCLCVIVQDIQNANDLNLLNMKIELPEEEINDT